MKRRIISPVFLVAFVLAGTTVSPAFADGVNLLANPGFEDGGGSYTDWFTFGGGVQLSLPAGDDIIRTGAAASKIYGEFTLCPGPGQFTVGGYGQAFTPTAGKVYHLSGYSFVSGEDPIPGSTTCDFNRAVAKIAFFDAASAGNEIASNEIVIGDWNFPRDRWVGFSIDAPVPAGALRVEALILYLQPACDTGAVYVDDLAFSEETPAAETNLLTNPSFDTGLSGWNLFGNVYYDGRPLAVRTPTGCAKMYSTFVADSPSGMFQTLAASPGTSWILDVHTKTLCEDPVTGSNDNFVTVKIVFRDASSNEIGSSETVVQTGASPVGTWTRHTLLAVNAPEGTASVEPYILFISPSLEGGSIWVDDVSFRSFATTGVPVADRQPDFRLLQNTPNPFSPSTRIAFDLEQGSQVDLSIYDVVGRRVRTLVEGSLGAGPHTVTWDGRSQDGTRAAAGIYRYVLRTPDGRVARSMLLIR